MYRIRRFGVLRTATVVALMYVVLILIIFIPIVLVLVAVTPVSRTEVPAEVGPPGTLDGAGLQALGLVGVLVGGLIVALIYGLIGWILTAVACLVYNLVARWTGGIEVEVTAAPPPLPPARWAPAAAAPPEEPRGP